MDEARVGIRREQLAHTGADFIVVLRRERLHHNRHRPSVAVADVRTADALASLATEEVGIVLAPHEAARVQIDGVVHRHVAEVAHRQERRHVGIVHQQLVAEAIDLESVNRTVFRMLVHGILFQCRFHLIGQCRAFRCEVDALIHFREDFSRFAQARNRHKIGRNEEEEGRGIVARTEHRRDESDGLHGIAPTVVLGGVGSAFGATLETIRTQISVLALLFAEGCQDVVDGFNPEFVENRGVARHEPILIGQSQRIAERVDFIFPLVQERFHRRQVLHPLAVGVRFEVERVGVGVEADAAELPQNRAAHHFLQFRVLVDELHIGPHLCTRVAQPHRVDVARIDEGVVVARCVGVMHRRFECVREAVAEHPRQFRVGFQQFLHLLDFLVNHFRAKQSVFFGRSSRDESRAFLADSLDVLLAEIGLRIHG